MVSAGHGRRSSWVYELLYLVGFRPWERGGMATELRELVEGTGALRAGRALDVGCGTGGPAIYLARHGWSVTGVDVVARAIREARRAAEAAGVPVSLVHGDVSRLEELAIGEGFNLILDFGCFHGLDDVQRARFAAAVTRVAAPEATMLMFTLAPGHGRLAAWRGASDEEIAARFHGWDVVWKRPDRGKPPWGPLRRYSVSGRWFRLQRHGDLRTESLRNEDV